MGTIKREDAMQVLKQVMAPLKLELSVSEAEYMILIEVNPILCGFAVLKDYEGQLHECESSCTASPGQVSSRSDRSSDHTSDPGRNDVDLRGLNCWLPKMARPQAVIACWAAVAAAAVVEDLRDPRLALYLPKHLRDAAQYRSAVQRILRSVQEVGLIPKQPLPQLRRRMLRRRSAANGERIENVQVYRPGSAALAKLLLREGGVRFVVAWPSCSLESLEPPAVVLDGITSALNLGQLIRSAGCLGVTSFVASEPTWSAFNGRLAALSAGAAYHARVARAHGGTGGVVEVLQRLRQKGWRLLAAEEFCEKTLAEASVENDGPWALVLGSEELGVSPEVLRLCEGLRVPQLRGQSLNASFCSGPCSGLGGRRGLTGAGHKANRGWHSSAGERRTP
eukprot:g8558.t1